MGRGKSKATPKTLFAKRLARLIGDKNLSEFERNNLLSAGSVSKIYGGAEPTRPTLEAIIKGTGCSAAWLIFGEGEVFRKGEGMASDKQGNLNLKMSIGFRLASFLAARFPGYTFEQQCEAFGYPKERVYDLIEGNGWLTGDEVLRLIELGCGHMWLLDGEDHGEMPVPTSTDMDTDINRGQLAVIRVLHETRQALMKVITSLAAEPLSVPDEDIADALRALRNALVELEGGRYRRQE